VDVNEPFKTEVVDISTSDHVFAMRVQSIYCNEAGTLVVRIRGDSTDRTYKVAQYQTLFGAFSQVTKIGSTPATANAFIGQRSADFEEKEGLANYPGPA
jgi:hypothetical protein